MLAQGDGSARRSSPSSRCRCFARRCRCRCRCCRGCVEVPASRPGQHALRLHAARGPDHHARGRAVPRLPGAQLQRRSASPATSTSRSTRTRPTICSRPSRRSCAAASAGTRCGWRSPHDTPAEVADVPAPGAAPRDATTSTRSTARCTWPISAPLVRARRAARAPRRAVRRRRSCPPLRDADDIFRGDPPSTTSCCTTRTSRSTPWSSSSPRRPTTRTCWPSSRRSTAPAATRPIVRALVRAAENGKQVTALVELKARFDEEHNIAVGAQLEEAGVHVVYGFIGLKTHCKVALVVRREGDGIRRYVHLATGNYNPTTARLYTDLGLFTARDDFADDAGALFNLLTGYSRRRRGSSFVVAPHGPARADHRADRARAAPRRAGQPARIIAKMNALVDPQVDRGAVPAPPRRACRSTCIVRGICCLRPGLPGRHREHPRRSASSTASWSTPHLLLRATAASARSTCRRPTGCRATSSRRVEVMFPVEDAGLRDA